tara:strand:+ start:221 stop:1348 length:1128 start_codon:yes stop_codon:yes gene_type:complete
MAKAKIDANRGDLFEAFFAAAVAARFVKRMEKKTERKLPLVEGKDVDKVLTEMMKRGYKKKVNDVGSAIMDTVSVSVSIPAKATAFLQKKENWKKVTDLRDGAIRFVNGNQKINIQSKDLSLNVKDDTIKVIAAGTEDQKGTKADVKVEIKSKDKKYKTTDYSLKVSGGEQFHQVSGLGFDKFVNIFGEMGLSVKESQAIYEKKLTEFFDNEVYTKKYSSREDAEKTGGGDNLKESAKVVYEQAQRTLEKGLNANFASDVKKKFADYIVFGLSRNVETELVKFESEKEVKSFVINEQFKEQLLQGRYTTELVKTGSPTVKIYRADDTGKKLAGKENFIMQIRYKLEVASSSSQGTKVYKFYPRHYLEAQPGMFSL